MGGVGYGWMQSIIEVEWRFKDERGALGPRQAMAWLKEAEAERDRLRKALEEVLEVSRDREAFVMQGPRAWSKAEQIAKRALATCKKGETR